RPQLSRSRLTPQRAHERQGCPGASPRCAEESAYDPPARWFGKDEGRNDEEPPSHERSEVAVSSRAASVQFVDVREPRYGTREVASGHAAGRGRCVDGGV